MQESFNRRSVPPSHSEAAEGEIARKSRRISLYWHHHRPFLAAPATERPVVREMPLFHQRNKDTSHVASFQGRTARSVEPQRAQSERCCRFLRNSAATPHRRRW